MTTTKRALLVGSSFSAVPIYFELKNRGLHVTVCGGLKEDPCHQYADESVYVDYSHRDQLLRVAEEGDFDYLVPSCNDYSYLSSSWVAGKLGYPGFDTAEVTAILHTKDLFRNFTHSRQLKAPSYYRSELLDLKTIELPCLVKPVDAFSGRGVTKVGRQEDLERAVSEAKKSSRGGDYVVEQYVEGTLHSHSAFVSGGAIVSDFFVDEFCTTYPYQVNCSNHPSRLGAVLKSAVASEMEKIIRELRICDGLIHTQFITNGDEFWIIECMRRCPGDLYGQLIERSTGLDYTAMFVAPFVGDRYPKSPTTLQALPYGRHTVSVDSKQLYFSYSYEIPASNLEIIQLKQSGEVLGPAPHDKLAILIFQFPNNEVMFDSTPKLAEMIAFHRPRASYAAP